MVIDSSNPSTQLPYSSEARETASPLFVIASLDSWKARLSPPSSSNDLSSQSFPIEALADDSSNIIQDSQTEHLGSNNFEAKVDMATLSLGKRLGRPRKCKHLNNFFNFTTKSKRPRLRGAPPKEKAAKRKKKSVQILVNLHPQDHLVLIPSKLPEIQEIAKDILATSELMGLTSTEDRALVLARITQSLEQNEQNLP